jgi:hypothetical protein
LIRASSGSQLGLQHDVLANQTTQYVFEVADQHIEIQNVRRKNLATAEGEQLPSQRCRAFRRGLDFLQIRQRRRAGRQVAHQQVSVAYDDGGC